MDLLARREHGRVELTRKLRQRGAEAELIETALDRLTEEGLLSEARYLESFVSYRARSGYGTLRIREELSQRGLQRNRSVRPSFAPGAAGTGGGPCLEALPLQVAGTAHIPRVGQHEATLRVQLAEERALLLCVGIGRDHGRAPGRQTCTLARPAATLNDNGAHLHEVMPPAYWTLWMRVPERACLPTRCRHGALHAPGPADPHRRRR